MRSGKKQAAFSALLAIPLLIIPVAARAQSGVMKQTGMLPDGATYVMEVPANWNGTLFLYSHGYVVPGSANPAQDFAITDPATPAFMLANGFALAGSSYATTGWAVEQALPDQIAVLDIFSKAVGTPKRTIAWGHSLGGHDYCRLDPTLPRSFRRGAPYVWRAFGRSCDVEYRARFCICL